MITEKLKQIILNELNLSDLEIKEETTANNVPGWDSLKHINIILAVENQFNIKFKGLEMLRIKNVGDLQKLINSKTQS